MKIRSEKNNQPALSYNIIYSLYMCDKQLLLGSVKESNIEHSEKKERKKEGDGGVPYGSENGFFTCSCWLNQLATLSVWFSVVQIQKGQKEAPSTRHQRASTFFSTWESS